ncbi:hypothetical protein ACWXWL_06535 [Pantoea ananatis]
MTKFQPYKKGTVLALSGKGDHLHVICNDPVFYPVQGFDCVLAVNISSVKAGIPFDSTCRLYVGDHPFVKKESYVVYDRAVIWRVDNMAKQESDGNLKPHKDDMPDATFQRILAGFDISEDVEPKILKFWKSNCQE